MKVLFCWLFFALFFLPLAAQEVLYIEYNPKNKDVYFESEDQIRFYLHPTIHASSFIYNKKLNNKKEIYKSEISKKLVTKTKANEKAKAIREKRSIENEKETGIKVPSTWEFLFFNTFGKMYVFVPDSTGEKGILYPVSWRPAIE